MTVLEFFALAVGGGFFLGLLLDGLNMVYMFLIESVGETL